MVLLKPFGPRLAAGALPSRRSPMVAPGQPIRVPAFAVVPHEPLHTFHPFWPVRHYPHLRISARGLGLSGTSTHLTRQLSGTHYAAVRLLRPSGPASAPRLPEPTRDRQGGCGRPEVSQVPTRSLTARTGLRPRWSDGPSQNGPAHVACGGSQRLGLHGKSLSRLNTVLVVSLCTLRDHRRR